MKNTPANIGAAMWLQLERTFLDVLEVNEAVTTTQRAHMWAGFFAAGGGAMIGDIGKRNAVRVLELVAEGLEGMEP